jgi:NAD(P)-dependent dehydrogenase (short-subunit alcohol dehydrogenase family)
MTASLDVSDVPDYAAMLRLDGKRFVVLGAGQGIGRQAAHALASVGARVVCADVDADRARAVAAEVGGLASIGNAASRETVRDLFAYAGSELGGLDGVVDIIGMARYKTLAELTDDDWQWHRDMGVRHAYLTIQYAAPLLTAAGGGSISFVASIAGLRGSAGLGPYGVEKAGLMSLARTAAVELGPAGIRVNTVAPGPIRTPRAEANPAWTDDLLEENINRTPLRKLGYPPDVAATLLYLSTPLSSHVSGQTIVLDGGFTVEMGVATPGPGRT